jgi:hypothetical protein
MRQIIWTNFAISELKNIFLYYRMVAGEFHSDLQKLVKFFKALNYVFQIEFKSQN